MDTDNIKINQAKEQIEIHLADENQAALWDEFVMSHPKASHCHLFSWKKVIQDTYRQSGYYFYAMKNGTLIGILPTIHIKSPIFSSSLVSMPYLSYGGTLVQEKEAAGLLIEAAVNQAKKLKVAMVDLRDKPVESLDISSDDLLKYKKVRMVKKLPDSGTELLSSFPSKLRSQIKRPLKAGMTFSLGGIEFLDAFYDVFKLNMRDLGSPVHSKLFFKNIFKHFFKKVRIGIVQYNDIVVAAGIIISFNNEVEIPWASTIRKYNKFSPNMLLYFSLLEYCCDKKMTSFDFGRSTPGEGTFRFKKQWGAIPEPLVWQNIPVGKQIDHEEYEETSEKDRMQFFIRLWQKLPVPIATALGPWIRGGISK